MNKYEVAIHFDGEMWHADNEWLGVYGYGDTLDKAVDDASKDIAYLRGYYTSLGDDEVIGHGSELKQRFAQLQDKIE